MKNVKENNTPLSLTETSKLKGGRADSVSGFF